MATNQPNRSEREEPRREKHQGDQDSMSRAQQGQGQTGQQGGMGGTGQGKPGQNLIGQRHVETGGGTGVGGFSEEEIDDEIGAMGQSTMTGRRFSQEVDPNEDAYWRQEYARRPYFKSGRSYDDYEPAYRLGYRAAESHRGGTYDDQLDEDLRGQYEQSPRKGQLDWQDVRPAVRDAFTHRSQRGQQHRRSEA